MTQGRSWVEAAGALAVLAVLAVAAPEFDYESRYSYDDIELSEVGRLREYDVRITGLRLTSLLQRNQDRLETEQAFVLVRLAVDVRTDVQNLRNIRLVTDRGSRYNPRPEWFSAEPPITQPGFTSEGTLVFEVPREDLTNAVLIVGPDLGETTGYDRAVRVRLGLDDDQPVEPYLIEPPDATIWVTP